MKKTKYSKVLEKGKKKTNTKYSSMFLLDLTLSTLGFRNDFYSFKRKLISIISRNQLFNDIKFGTTLKSNELVIAFADFISPEKNVMMRIDKESIKHLIKLFEKVLKHTNYNILFFNFERNSHTSYGLPNQIKEYFEKTTKLSYRSTLENYNKKKGE